MPDRPEFVTSAPFSAVDLNLEQRYRWQHGRNHDRFLHGWGVVCGLHVIPVRDSHCPWAVRVCPGYAVSPCGDEIYVPCSVVIDIAEWMWAIRTPADPQPSSVIIAIRFVAREEDPLPTPAEPCSCKPPSIELSRLADDFRIDVLPDGEIIVNPPVDLCQGKSADCPAAPASPYVPLARVNLPQAGLLINAGNIIALSG